MTGDQFKHWLREHLDRHRRGDWPEGDAAITFFGGWLHAFKARQVRPEEAEDASRWLAEKGASFPDNHLGLMLGRIEGRRRDAAAEVAARRLAEDRAAVEAEWEAERRQLDVWESLGEFDRQRIEAEIEAENPGLVRFPIFVKRLALARAAEQHATPEWRGGA